jgi:hypothetical protein
MLKEDLKKVIILLIAAAIGIYIGLKQEAAFHKKLYEQSQLTPTYPINP